ncbi:NACHT domain-containing protein [Mycena venus]|uniref:NACHT domain-containing protein n=1 Tax=Mycena venus TaxID=2733690 RepID=A0A8H6Y5T8_9AGAR|nr:NACHT domain-containing protein [Mycena venus]
MGGVGGNGGRGEQGGAGGAGEGPTTSIEAGIVHIRSMHGRPSIIAQAVNHHHHHHHAETGIQILHQAVALEALYDSADSYPQPRCHPETRTEILDTLYNWAVQLSKSTRPIRWLHGPAGAGKSAIMQTLCQKLHAAGRLGGAFFFKRDHPTRGNAKVLFATLAYQLALNSHILNPAIFQSVERDASVVGRSMDVQLRELIVEPCQSLTTGSPLILLIDGLDECQNESTQQEIIRLIARTVADPQKSHPPRFLIASSPEAHIREIFEDPLSEGIFDSMDVEQSFKDIRTYFQLVWKSSGYFIYASTVSRFIDDKYSRPTERLAVVQNFSKTDSDAPFASLDQLYIQILSRIPPRFRGTLRDILECSAVQQLCLTPVQLESLLELGVGDVQLILRSLHSVLEVSSESSTISVHHASFSDFLEDQRRSSIFHVDLDNRTNVSRAILKAFSDDNRWPDNPDDPLVWRLSADDFSAHLTWLPPSAELVPLIEHLNPDFLWGRQPDDRLDNRMIQEILTWLKTIRPIPDHLIQRWEDYNFMLLWDATNDQGTDTKYLNGIFSLSSPMLRVLQTKMSGSLPVSLANCRQLTCLAQPLPGGGSQNQIVAGTITILALVLELYPAIIPGLIADLGCGMLRLIQRTGAADSVSVPYMW